MPQSVTVLKLNLTTCGAGVSLPESGFCDVISFSNCDMSDCRAEVLESCRLSAGLGETRPTFPKADSTPPTYSNKVRKTPAATAEPITPATFGPMAGMRGFTLPSVFSETKF